MIDPRSVFERAPDVRYRLVHDEGVVIRQEVGEALVLNEVGAKTLDMLDGRTSVEDLTPRLVEDFDVDPGVLLADVSSFLEELLEIGVISLASHPV